MFNRYFGILVIISTWILCSQATCKSDLPGSRRVVSYYFPSEEEAKQIITSDDKEDYFERINQMDIKIQMQDDSDQQISIEDYKSFLESDITSFTDSERSRLKGLLDECNASFYRQKIKINLDKIAIIKTKGKTYGPQAFFTREHAIMVPATQLKISDNALKSVLLHEIFHIMSRYDRVLKTKAYALIGFEPLPFAYNVQNKNLNDRILLNPDGLSNDFGIKLENGKGAYLWGVPLLHARHPGYRTDITNYFEYINFEVYRLDEKRKLLTSLPNLSNDVPAEYFNNFFAKISDNTDYIIHPDEIMADNFMLMIKAYDEDDFTDFSDSGMLIVTKLKDILTDN